MMQLYTARTLNAFLMIKLFLKRLSSIRRLVILNILLLPITLLGTALAIPTSTPYLISEHALDNHIPLVTEIQRNDLNHIFAFDYRALGARTPVILVPGRAEEFQNNAWWKTFRKKVYNNRFFDEYFKLYVYIYNSKQELAIQTEGFSQDIKKYFNSLPAKQKVVLISYSLGGIITKEAMEDPEIFQRVHSILAIAVPFHGSPIFDKLWFTQYLQAVSHSPIRRVWDQLTYRLYLFDKTNLTRGLRWDNFDNSRPQFDHDKTNIQGDQVNTPILPYVETLRTDAIKKKTRIYASYLENEYTESLDKGSLTRIINTSKALPKAIIGSVLPFYGFSVHSVFNYTNLQLANLSTYTPNYPLGQNTHLYRYNDGAIPLTSLLWLPPRSEPYKDDINGLCKAIDVPFTRIFVNLDHLDIGEYNHAIDKLETNDMLHPQDGKRTPNEWLLYDLQHIAGSLQSDS